MADAAGTGGCRLDDQQRACQGYVVQQPGWRLLEERFDDRGLSGANLDRPALQRLLRQVDAGRVDVVIVQRTDRLSRWYLDFVALMERLRTAGVAFVAVHEGFSTANAAGQSTLGVLLSFAELQRAATPPDEIHTAADRRRR